MPVWRFADGSRPRESAMGAGPIAAEVLSWWINPAAAAPTLFSDNVDESFFFALFKRCHSPLAAALAELMRG